MSTKAKKKSTPHQKMNQTKSTKSGAKSIGRDYDDEGSQVELADSRKNSCVLM